MTSRLPPPDPPDEPGPAEPGDPRGGDPFRSYTLPGSPGVHACAAGAEFGGPEPDIVARLRGNGELIAALPVLLCAGPV